MASKRAVQLFGARSNTSVIGRQTSRLSFNTAYTFSLASRQQHTCVSQNRVAAPRGPSRLQVATVQKRWHSQAPSDVQLNKVYQFEDVCRLLIPLQITTDYPRSCTPSNTPPTPAFSLMCANRMSSRPTRFPLPSTSPSHRSPTRYS